MASHKPRKITIFDKDFGWNYINNGGFYVKTPEGVNHKVDGPTGFEDINIVIENGKVVEKKSITPRGVAAWIRINIFGSKEFYVPKSNITVKDDFNYDDSSNFKTSYAVIKTYIDNHEKDFEICFITDDLDIAKKAVKSFSDNINDPCKNDVKVRYSYKETKSLVI